MTSLQKLIFIASDSLNSDATGIPGCGAELGESLSSELQEMLSMRNGFFAFDDALHVFPANSSGPYLGLQE
jgi:hypothetical protein